MLLVYASKTGNVKRLIAKLNHQNSFQIITGEEEINEPFILLTYTTGIGEIPKEVEQFVHKNYHHLKYVIGSGNRNWGTAFCNAAKIISEQYQVPLLMKLELSGSNPEVLKLNNILEKISA